MSSVGGEEETAPSLKALKEEVKRTKNAIQEFKESNPSTVLAPLELSLDYSNALKSWKAAKAGAKTRRSPQKQQRHPQHQQQRQPQQHQHQHHERQQTNAGLNTKDLQTKLEGVRLSSIREEEAPSLVSEQGPSDYSPEKNTSTDVRVVTIEGHSAPRPPPVIPTAVLLSHAKHLGFTLKEWNDHKLPFDATSMRRGEGGRRDIFEREQNRLAAARRLVRESLCCPLPLGWSLVAHGQKKGKGSARYRCDLSGQVFREHPLDDYFREKIRTVLGLPTFKALSAQPLDDVTVLDCGNKVGFHRGPGLLLPRIYVNLTTRVVYLHGPAVAAVRGHVRSATRVRARA